MTDTKVVGPIEVWLTQSNLQVTCTVVREDESTDSLDVDSLSMRGAMREITGYLLSQGYKPNGRWSAEVMSKEGDTLEAVRKFKPPTKAEPS